MATPAQQFEKVNDAFNVIQRELQGLVQSREVLEMQEQENKIVMDEFNSITDDNTAVYKLTGPVLVPQTKAEASMNVEKRLEFIRAEIKRVESSISLKQQGAEEKRNELLRLRAVIQGAPQ